MFLTPLLFTLVFASRLVFSAPSGDIVDVGYAKYLGNRTFPNSVAYLGIPYAEPPLGERRFRAPLPLNTTRITQESNGYVIGATEYPDFCVQGSIGRMCFVVAPPIIEPFNFLEGDHGGAGSEDCLKINIYAPVGAKEGDNCELFWTLLCEKLRNVYHVVPVLFYIHGGGLSLRFPFNIILI